MYQSHLSTLVTDIWVFVPLVQFNLGKRDVLQRAVKPKVAKMPLEIGLRELLGRSEVEPELLG